MAVMQAAANPYERAGSTAARTFARSLRLVSPGDQDEGDPGYQPSRTNPADREDLPYKVEVWNPTGAVVEQVVAVTANASIGYAAYYAATREFPDRHITLRHKNSIVARWSGPKN